LQRSSLERTAWALLLVHVLVSLFGLIGIAIMVPNPHIWSDWSHSTTLFPFAVQKGGNLQIYLGAAAVLLFGAATVGWRPALIFFTVSVALSTVLEFTGTSYGWPFGNYEYTDLFGYKFLEKVPPAIPLSWFFMGFASFGLATALIQKMRGSAGLWASIILGSALLTSWDLVLDPAMSNEGLALRYWVWEDIGPYMGIPLVNFVAWLGTGAVFMFAASFFDDRLRPMRVQQPAFFLAVYLCNLLFAVGICAANQLWVPTILGSSLAAAVLLAWFKPAAGSAAVQHRV
jgi:uncharacterized membrane protein